MENKMFVSKKWPVKMTGKMRVWPVKSAIRPDIVRWPAVIFSPGRLLTNIILLSRYLTFCFSSIFLVHTDELFSAQHCTFSHEGEKAWFLQFGRKCSYLAGYVKCGIRKINSLLKRTTNVLLCYHIIIMINIIINIIIIIITVIIIIVIILLHEEFLQFDWLRAVVFQLNFEYLHVKITNLLWAVV